MVMQTISEYLDGRKKADFAKQIGVSVAQLSQYISGYRRPSYERMLEIQSATGGEVTVESWQHVSSHDHSPTTVQDQGRA